MAASKDFANSYTLLISIILAVLLVSGSYFYSNSTKVQKKEGLGGKVLSQPSQTLQPDGLNIENVDIEGEPFIGNQNAPVTLAYWLDFQCPFCKRFETNILPTLVDKYVKEGKLKIVFKDFQFLGRDSQEAGLVAKAVWELYPQYYFKWHKAMYTAQDSKNSGFGNLESILNLIKEQIPEIDANKIALQIEKKRSEYQSEQDADKLEGSRFGIRGTPGFVIGTQRIAGVQPASVFIQIIEAELSKYK